MDCLQPLRQQHLLVLRKCMYMRMLGACPKWVTVLQIAPGIQHLANAYTELQLVISRIAEYSKLHIGACPCRMSVLDHQNEIQIPT